MDKRLLKIALGGIAVLGWLAAVSCSAPGGSAGSGGAASVTRNFAVSDYANHRVLLWTSMPTSTDQPADIVLGQPDFTQNTADNGGITGSVMNHPYGVAGGDSHLMVADRHDNRILIWTSIPATNGQSADLILGQSLTTTATANLGGIGASTLNAPLGVWYDTATKYTFVADTGNNRVLIWTHAIVSNAQAADLVLGQPDFVSNTSNNGGVSAISLSNPKSIYSDGTRLFVGDAGNNRVLIWNSFPTSNRQAADVVVGQADMTSSGALAIGAAAINNTGMMFVLGTKLFVGDETWARVTVWNTIPTTNGAAADYVLGQPDFTTSTGNTGGIGANTLAGPQGVTSDGEKLYVVDNDNMRILGWNSIPTTTQSAADFVFGQADMTSNSPNAGGTPSAQTLSEPGIAVTFIP